MLPESRSGGGVFHPSQPQLGAAELLRLSPEPPSSVSHNLDGAAELLKSQPGDTLLSPSQVGELPSYLTPGRETIRLAPSVSGWTAADLSQSEPEATELTQFSGCWGHV